jgi:hypothetical protein
MQLLIGEHTAAGDSTCNSVAALLQLLIGEHTAAGDSSCNSVAALLQLLILLRLASSRRLLVVSRAYVSIRQHTSAYVSIRHEYMCTLLLYE